MQDSHKLPDFSKIDESPLEVEGEDTEFGEGLTGLLFRENSRLRFENENLEAEIERLSGKVDAAQEKAKLIRPFSWWVFGFASVYCLIIFGLIALDGMFEKVNIDPTVLSIMAGTTAASVLGLVSVILTGLYKSD